MVAAGRLVGLAHAGAASQPGSDGGRTDEQEKTPPLDRHPDTLPRAAGLGPGSAATGAGCPAPVHPTQQPAGNRGSLPAQRPPDLVRPLMPVERILINSRRRKAGHHLPAPLLSSFIN